MFNNEIENGDIVVFKNIKNPLVYINNEFYELQENDVVAVWRGGVVNCGKVIRIYRSKEELKRNTIQWIYDVGKNNNYNILLDQFDLIFMKN